MFVLVCLRWHELKTTYFLAFVLLYIVSVFRFILKLIRVKSKLLLVVLHFLTICFACRYLKSLLNSRNIFV